MNALLNYLHASRKTVFLLKILTLEFSKYFLIKKNFSRSPYPDTQNLHFRSSVR